jgi:outer membrane lipopolysaccharide assembly protein LptE/RlpB
MNETVKMILEIMLRVFLPILFIYTTYLIDKGIQAWQGKIKNEKVKSYLDEIRATSAVAAGAVQQVYVQALKDDDVFTVEKQKEALNKALQIIINSLSTDTMTYIQESNVDVEEFLIPYVESAVYQQKKTA